MNDDFPDRREMLFGRIADLHALTDRARSTGLTIVSGKPLMGKTWTLTETARLLTEEGYLVGYHESKAAEVSHLLYAVANLYTRWLSDSSMREQAISLWKRHKGNLVPRVGQVVGTLFEKLLAAQWPSGAAGVVRIAFDNLAGAQKDLLSGGLQLAPLSYDQALSLTELVADVSKRPVVLMLDAWEKSPSLRSELATLEALLKHRHDWPNTHVFLGVRTLELDSTKLNDEPFRRASDLCRINGAARVHELGSLKLDDPKERNRMVNFLKNAVPAANGETEQALIYMIDGYPAVIDFWTNDATAKTIRTPEDLRKVAREAQNRRYLELEHILSLTTDAGRTLAARLAIFQRLSRDTWPLFREVLMGNQSEADIDELIDARALKNEDYPTYGHDTRHAAARHWFMENKPALIRRAAEAIIEATASRIVGLDASDEPLLEALTAFSDQLERLKMNPRTSCLVHAALSVKGDIASIAYEQFDVLSLDACRENASLSTLVAIAYLNRGIHKTSNDDLDEAISDFSTVIALPGDRITQHAQALFNRGYVQGLKGEIEAAIADYTTLLALPNANVAMKARALVNRGHARSQDGKSKQAIQDYTLTIETPDAPEEYVITALINRGIKHSQENNFTDAISDLTRAISFAKLTDEQLAIAHCERAQQRRKTGEEEGALEDYIMVISLPEASPKHKARAHVERGYLHYLKGNYVTAFNDYTLALSLAGAPIEQVVHASFNRGVLKHKLGDQNGAFDDYTFAIDSGCKSTEYVVRSLLNRGSISAMRAFVDSAIADFTHAIELSGVKGKHLAQAYFNRGLARRTRGENETAMADFSAVVAVPDAPPHLLALVQSLVGENMQQPKDD